MGLVWPCGCRPRPSEQAAPGWCRDGAQRLCRLCEPSLDPAPWQSVDTLDLLTELKRRVEMPPGKNIILIGPPGSGKGTQVRPARSPAPQAPQALHALRLCAPGCTACTASAAGGLARGAAAPSSSSRSTCRR